MPRFEVLEDVARLHETPLAVIRVEEGRVVVEADDERERRIRLVCQPYQAMRVVTADCFVVPDILTIHPGTIVEVRESSWLAELTVALREHDHTATFMEKARHFLIPLQDDFVEVVAWAIRCEPAE